jgi:hypothetical protein
MGSTSSVNRLLIDLKHQRKELENYKKEKGNHSREEYKIQLKGMGANRDTIQHPINKSDSLISQGAKLSVDIIQNPNTNFLQS